MIDFAWTEDHQAVFKLVKEFGQKEVIPFIRERDRQEKFDPSILKKMAEADLLGICIPTKYGGAGFDYISLGIACQELEYADTSLRVILSVHIGLTSLPYLTWGNEAQKQKYLVPQAKGEKIGSFGLTEPNAGSDVVGIQSTADKKDGFYVLNGEKMWISLADVADSFLCVAWTDRKKRDKRDHSGLSAFIVERDLKGVKTGTIHGKLGVRAGNTGYISLSDVEVPQENMLGEEGEGFKIAMFCLDQGRYTVAAGASGLTKACLDASVNYSKTRKTFNTFIGEHQLVKEMIAYMVSGFEASQLLWVRAGWLKNQGLTNSRETALAKWFACEVAERSAADAVQVFGSYGFSDEYPVERFYRNAKGSSIYEGTREIQKLLQADYALGYKVDKVTRCPLPKYQPGW